MRDRLVGLAPPWALDPAGDSKEQRRALYRLGRERYRDLALLLAADGRLDREFSLGCSRAPPRGTYRNSRSPGAM